MAQIEYNTVKSWYQNQRIPNSENLLILSATLGVSMEFLLTGEDSIIQYPHRIKIIADKCLKASKNDLVLVERILRIEEKVFQK